MSTEATGNGGQIARATVIDVPMSEQRSLATVTAEIRTIRAARDKMFLEASVEIGRRLKEAKELVRHGGWGEYCKTELDFSQQTAQNHIRLFEAYAADQIRLDGAALKSKTLGNLSYTQALELLALPSEEEREDFVAEHDMDSLSTRELHAEIARLREEKEAAEADAREINAQKRQAEARAEEADKRCLSLRNALSVMQKARKADEEHWDELKEQAREACAARDEAEQEAAQAKEALYSAEAAQKAAEADKKLLAKEKDRAEKEAKAAQKALDEARKNPQVPQEVLDRLKREAEEAAKKAADAERVAAVQAAKEEMASDARRYKEELEAAQKALKLAAPEMAVFRASFERVQGELLALVGSVDELPADKQAGAWKAMAALAGQISRIVEERGKGVDA